MMPRDEERPVFGLDLACSSLDPRFFTRQAQKASLGAAIHIGARVFGIVQDAEDASMAQRSPNHLAMSAATPEPRGALEVMVTEVFDDGQG